MRKAFFLALAALAVLVPSLGVGLSSAGAAANSSTDPSVIGQFVNFTNSGVTNDYYQPPSPAIGLHMVLLRTGDVLVLGPFKYNYAPWDGTAYVWNPTPGAPNNGFVKEVDPPDNIFCSGIAFLSDGTVVLTGGRLHDVKFAGPPLTYTFDPISMTWQQQPNIAFGRFYPTETELPGGRIISTSGGNETGWYNDTIDVVTPGTPQLSVHTTPSILDFEEFYPRQWLMPDGNVVVYQNKSGFIINTANPNPDDWTTSALPDSKYYHSGYGPASVLLPSGPEGPSKMLVIGGGGDRRELWFDCGFGGSGTNNVEELDYNHLAAGWKTLAPMPGPGREVTRMPSCSPTAPCSSRGGTPMARGTTRCTKSCSTTRRRTRGRNLRRMTRRLGGDTTPTRYCCPTVGCSSAATTAGPS